MIGQWRPQQLCPSEGTHRRAVVRYTLDRGCGCGLEVLELHIVMRPATFSHYLYSLACLASCGSHSGCLIAVRSHASREPTWLNHRKTVVTGWIRRWKTADRGPRRTGRNHAPGRGGSRRQAYGRCGDGSVVGQVKMVAGTGFEP